VTGLEVLHLVLAAVKIRSKNVCILYIERCCDISRYYYILNLSFHVMGKV
jgi:hypothetical protein